VRVSMYTSVFLFDDKVAISRNHRDSNLICPWRSNGVFFLLVFLLFFPFCFLLK
jgi:hypothetical protein